MIPDSVPEEDGTAAQAMQQLLLRVAQGDRAAFASLYDRTAGQVFQQIRRLLVDPSQSEEVAQEVFLEIWQTAARYQPDRGAVMPWMLTIARRRAIDRVRASQASRARDLLVGARSVVQYEDSVADYAETRSESADVRRKMSDLTALQRQAVELSYLHELTLAEMSERLLVPIGTVKTRVRDGILKLRTAVQGTP